MLSVSAISPMIVCATGGASGTTIDETSLLTSWPVPGRVPTTITADSTSPDSDSIASHRDHSAVCPLRSSCVIAV